MMAMRGRNNTGTGELGGRLASCVLYFKKGRSVRAKDFSPQQGIAPTCYPFVSLSVLRGFHVFFLTICIALLWIQGADAQDVTVRASVDRTRVEVGDQIQFTVEVDAAQMGSVSAPQVPASDGFQLTGTSSSTSMSVNFINGAMTTKRTTTYIFSYRAEKEGAFVLGPAQLTHEGRTVRSEQVRVEVAKRSGRPQTRPAPSTGRSMGQADIREIEQNLFLQAIPEKRVVYVGEQVGVTYKLFTRYDLRNVQYGHVPDVHGVLGRDCV